MAEKTENENPGTAKTVQPGNQPENNTVNPVTASADSNPDSENMEVHHHAHHGGKKTWKAYFWEFLMLFLAVFCGFLAENIREHQVEHQREKEYMEALYQDLKTDTLNQGILINRKSEEITNYDSLFDIFKTKKYLQETSGAYYFGRKLLALRPFYPANGTITQLINAGGLRLIRNRAVVDSIQSYEQAISFLKSVEDFEREHFNLARSTMGKIFDADVFDMMIDKAGNGNTLTRPDKNYPLMPFTQTELNEFHVPMNFIKRNKITQIMLLKGLQKRASDLMALLQEKYHIREE